MKLRHHFVSLLFLGLALIATAQDKAADAAEHDTTTAAAAVVATRNQPPPPPDFLEHLVDAVLVRFNVPATGNTWAHYGLALLFLAAAILLRRVVTNIIFNQLKKFAAKTETTLDDKLFPAMEAPVATFIMLVGIFSALKVLKFSEVNDRVIGYGSTVAFSLVMFWGLLRALDALLDHAHEVARERQMGVAAFMPWIKKTLIAVSVVFGVLLIVQSLGYNVTTILQGLGIGGLAFALAAQDTIANLFGSIVVAIDQPFKLGEVIKIQGNVGTVEDIGLRSTKLRLIDKSLIVMPNKMVAAESIVNLSRFTGRRVEQVLTLTYDTTAAQMEELVAEVRRLLLAEPEIDPASVICYFRDFNSSSLDIWIVFNVKDPDFHNHMVLRQRLNLAFMRAVEARGLSFAFPTQTVHVASLPAATPPAVKG
ncbi:MAG TPA: mechanosensitive ion channel family protein [Lacunisphaera sp.]|nr:mechanosensitive ion channel family protein [Lacunisphaera sp.]